MEKQNNLSLQVKGILESEASQVRIMGFFGDNKEKCTKFKSALISISQSDSLRGCTTQSIIKSAFNLAETGLEISPVLGQCYIVKYKQEAEPVISYKGWQTLIERAGKRVKAFSVFKCDDFSIDLSDFEEKVKFIPNLDERKESDDKWYQNNLKGVLVRIKDFKDNYVKNIFVSVDKIEKIKGKSPSAKSSFSPYNNWAEEMYLAKAIKYSLSREALNFKDENIAKAIVVENDVEMKVQNDNKQVKKDILEDILEAEVESEVENKEVEDTLIKD